MADDNRAPDSPRIPEHLMKYHGVTDLGGYLPTRPEVGGDDGLRNLGFSCRRRERRPVGSQSLSVKQPRNHGFDGQIPMENHILRPASLA